MKTFFCLAALVSAFLACQVTGALGTLDPLIGRPNENYGSSKILTAAELEELLGSDFFTAEDTALHLSQVGEAEHNTDISHTRISFRMTVAEALEFNNFDKEKCSPQFIKERVNFYLKLVPLINDWEDLLFTKGETRIRINLIQYCRAILQLVVRRCAAEELTLKAYDNYIRQISEDLGPMIPFRYNPDENIYDYGEFFVKEMPFETKILDIGENPDDVITVRRNLATRRWVAQSRWNLFEISPPDQNTRSLIQFFDVLNEEGPLKDPKETFLILKSLVTPQYPEWIDPPGDGYQMNKRLDDALYQAGYSGFTNLAMTIGDLVLLNKFHRGQCYRMRMVRRFNRYRELMTREVKREKLKVEDLNSLKGDRKIILNIIRYCRALLERFVRACTADGVKVPQNDQKFFDQAKQFKKVSEGSWNYDEYLKYINLMLPLEEFGVEALKDNTRKGGFPTTFTESD